MIKLAIICNIRKIRQRQTTNVQNVAIKAILRYAQVRNIRQLPYKTKYFTESLGNSTQIE